MLLNIDPILNPQLLFVLRSMGHGDRLVLCDANFPAYSISQETVSKEIIRLDGVSLGRATEAILSVFPLDGFVSNAVQRMEIDGQPQEENKVHKEFVQAVHQTAGNYWKTLSLERQEFYQEAKSCYTIVTTTDPRPYGCFILTKGVLDAEGKVIVQDGKKFVAATPPVHVDKAGKLLI